MALVTITRGPWTIDTTQIIGNTVLASGQVIVQTQNPANGAVTSYQLTVTEAQSLGVVIPIAGATSAGPIETFIAQSGITAFAGGGQASATPLTSQINRVGTVATAGDSVKLPAAIVGSEVIVINAGANNMGVFGAGTDTVNGQAAATGILQPPNSQDLYVCAATGVWTVESGAGFAGSLMTELAQSGITAFAGGGQASATQLTAMMNRVNTVATAGDSVKLPASAAGLDVIVVNHGANPCQVFGLGTDTIDDQAAATGVPQMPNSVVLYFCANSGQWYSEGLAVGFGGPGLATMSFTGGITAFAGGGQGSATALTTMLNRVTTVASAGDSVKLPASVSGLMITVINRGANAMQVFGAGTDTINGVASATGISMPANSVLTFNCVAVGLWEVPGVGTGFSGQLPTFSNTNNITAFAGGGQASAVLLTTVINRITVVASANDSVKLPVSAPGLQITVINAAAANSMNLFPNTGDAINALGANNAFAIPANKTAICTCANTGQWHSVLSA